MRLVFATACERVALYVDGKLKQYCEQYELQPWDLAHEFKFPITIESIEEREIDPDWFFENIRKIPKNLADVKFES